jgi:hypothetical protein
MKAFKIFLASLFLGITLSGCATIVEPGMATGNPIGEKTGKSSYTTIFGIAFNYDRGVAEAAKNGNIDKIATVDYKAETGFFTVTYTTVVTGK